MKVLIFSILSAIGILPVVSHIATDDDIKRVSIVEPTPSENQTTIGKWIVEDVYDQPDELDEYKWSPIIWGD